MSTTSKLLIGVGIVATILAVTFHEQRTGEPASSAPDNRFLDVDRRVDARALCVRLWPEADVSTTVDVDQIEVLLPGRLLSIKLHGRKWAIDGDARMMREFREAYVAECARKNPAR